MEPGQFDLVIARLRLVAPEAVAAQAQPQSELPQRLGGWHADVEPLEAGDAGLALLELAQARDELAAEFRQIEWLQAIGLADSNEEQVVEAEPGRVAELEDPPMLGVTLATLKRLPQEAAAFLVEGCRCGAEPAVMAGEHDERALLRQPRIRDLDLHPRLHAAAQGQRCPSLTPRTRCCQPTLRVDDRCGCSYKGC
jgi:hypothetical protein